jgi:hypothetical protein
LIVLMHPQHIAERRERYTSSVVRGADAASLQIEDEAMEIATTAAPLTASAQAPVVRLVSAAPRHAFASRRLMAVRPGSPTIVACIVALAVAASSAAGTGMASAKNTQTMGSAAPVAHVAVTAHGA